MRGFRYLVLALQLGACVARAAADGDREFRFEWPNPTAATRCELFDARRPDEKTARFAGIVERHEMGVACTVQFPRRRFDATYRHCAISYLESPEREHYACWVMYSPRYVTFLYSYSDEPTKAPGCAFVCERR